MMEQFLVENVERTDKESTNNGPADVEYFTKYYYRMQKMQLYLFRTQVLLISYA
uniref:Uncharacterized protein n=1 Tax=Romanomermis culicivorax TaxID=13658 RepID=A0A915K296_ROMCU